MSDNASLRVLNGPGKGRTFALDQSRMVMGRNDPPQVVVQIDLTPCELGEEPMVSRRHAELHWIQGKLYLVDLGSRNGTEVNGKPLQIQEGAKISEPVELPPGSHIKLADLELKLLRQEKKWVTDEAEID
ncbi:MAG: FHA domain-containing protein [Magnetococcales bacterium]|nr:FHA domain-containing protein [Magnetococcales bacterium]